MDQPTQELQLAHRLGQYHINQAIGVGAHVPIHCTALGKAMLASLTDEARRKLISRLDFVPWGPRCRTPRQRLHAWPSKKSSMLSRGTRGGEPMNRLNKAVEPR
jgi:hypothetical protein